jgi:alpha-N-arabinofuranosidase
VTLRDAIGAALTLDIFHRHSDKLSVANFTGLINQEGGLFLADGASFIETPIYHVFKMYGQHQGAKRIPVECDAPILSDAKAGKKSGALRHLSGSASLRDRTLTLTVVNPHPTENADGLIKIRGADIGSAIVTTLTHDDIHAHNTFERPSEVVPKADSTDVAASELRWSFAPASVTKFALALLA